MHDTPEPSGPARTRAEGQLAELGAQVEETRALLVRLLQDVVAAEKRLEVSRDGPLAEINERLVVAALSMQAEAEAATQALKEAVQSAALDTLTGLPTRSTLLDRLAHAIAGARRHGTRFALLFVDLDQFKPLNDTYGHRFGDRVLKLVAERLVSSVREVDTVSRHGGDEFVVLLAELAQPADAQVVADKLIAAIGAPAELEGHALGLTASVGIAIFPDDGQDVDTLISHADAAMYAHKRRRAGAADLTEQGGVRAAHDTPTAAGAAPVRTSAAEAGDSTEAADVAAAERRLAELREANEKLVLAALGAQQLHEAAEQARQRQAAFLASVAAELRNPAAPIRIAATMLGRESADETLLPRVQQIVGRQMAQMSRLVEAVNLDSGVLLPGRRPVDMAHVVDAALAVHKPVMARRRQRFELVVPTGPVVVLGDAARLEQVVSNLLDNASRYTHEGGSISLTLAVAGNTLTLTVADNGIGITAQMLPRLFEPFVQDPRALGFNGVGIGIGLTVARALVRAHGGQIAAYSAGAGRGSRFVVTLPLAPVEPVVTGTSR